MYNNCARVTILDAAVVKIVCGTQEGRLRARSELHPDDTASIGSQDWPPTRHSRAEKEPMSFAFTSDCLDKKATPRQATYWSPSHCVGEGSWQCSSHICSCLFRTAPPTSTDARLLDLQRKKYLSGHKGAHCSEPTSCWAQNACTLVLARCWAPPCCIRWEM